MWQHRDGLIVFHVAWWMENSSGKTEKRSSIWRKNKVNPDTLKCFIYDLQYFMQRDILIVTVHIRHIAQPRISTCHLSYPNKYMSSILIPGADGRLSYSILVLLFLHGNKPLRLWEEHTNAKWSCQRKGGDDLDSVVLGYLLGCVGEEAERFQRVPLISSVLWADRAGGQQTTHHVFFFFFCGAPEPQLNSTEHNTKQPDPNNTTVWDLLNNDYIYCNLRVSFTIFYYAWLVGLTTVPNAFDLTKCLLSVCVFLILTFVTIAWYILN